MTRHPSNRHERLLIKKIKDEHKGAGIWRQKGLDHEPEQFSVREEAEEAAQAGVAGEINFRRNDD